MGERRSFVICSDGWKDFLGSGFRLITPALFTCLARAERRGRWGFQPAGTVPLREGDRLLIQSENEFAELARFFGDGLRQQVPRGTSLGPSVCPLFSLFVVRR